MRVIKKITAFLLIFAMLASFMPYSVLAEETPGSDGTYEWIDNGSTISITNYIGSETNITIPSELSGKPVTEIAGGAFSEKSVVSVIMSNSVTSIGPDVFAGSTSLQSVQLSSSLDSISGEAFLNCSSLQSIVISNSVTSISFGAFKNCTNLNSVTLSNNLQYIGQSTFESCTSLDSISLPESIIGIGDNSFKNCTSLESISLPEGLTGIGDNSFENCTSLQTVYVYNSNIIFGTNVFLGDPLTEGIYGYDGSTADAYATSISKPFHALYTVTFNSNGGSSVNDKVVVDGSKITKPADPTKTNYSFEGWYKDSGLSDTWDFAADTVTADITLFAKWHENGTPYSNGTYEWEVDSDNIIITNYLGSDTNITIPSELDGKTVTNIAGGSFGGKSIVSVIVPDCVTSIGPGAFAGCTSLQSAQLPDTLINLGGQAFINCSSLTSINIPDTVTNISFGTFQNCTSLSNIALPDTLQSIGESAFEGCTSLESISFPASMVGVVNDAFKNCTALRDVYVYSKTMTFGEDGNNVFSGAQILYGIFAYEGSTGQTFAETFEYPYHALYTVTFDSNEGTSVDDIIITPTGSIISPPQEPSKDDYVFAGWYKDDDTFEHQWDFVHDIVLSNMVLYAKWETTITYTIVAQPNNVSYGSVTGSGDYTSGSDVTLTATPNNGYYFVKWLEGTTEVSTNYKYTFTSTANRTLSAVFSPIQAPLWTTVQSARYDSISLAWTTVTGATGYDVYRSTLASGPFNDHVYGGEAASYLDTGLTTGTTYYYKVIADCKTADWNSTGSASIVKPAIPIPGTAAVSVKTNAYNSLDISWGEVEGATGYMVYRSTSSSGTYVQVAKVTSGTSITNTGLATGTTYYYKVKAYTTVGGVDKYGNLSSYSYAKVIPSTPIATAVSASYNSVKISWPAVSGATGYTIYRSDTEGGTYAAIPATITKTSYTQTSLAMGKTYYYKVRAYRTVGTTKVYSLYSEATYAVPIPSAPVPTAVSTGYTSIKVSWPAVSGATGYKIYSTDENGENAVPLDENLLTAYYNHTSLTTNQTYYYKVVAFRTVNGFETPSSESVIVSAKPVPSAPAGLSAASAGYNSVNISWQEVTGAEGYMVSRAESSTGEYTNLYTTGDLNITDNNLTTGKTYYYKIRGIIYGSPTILGDYSAVVSVKAIPAAPVITVTATQYNSLTVSWDAVDGATGYKIYRSTSSKGTYAYVTSVTSTSYVNTGLAAGTTYYYKVIAYRTEGTVTTNSLYSAYKYAKVIPAAPSATAASYSYNSIKISWGAVSGRTAYQVYRATTESGTYSLIATTTSTSYINTSLTTGNTYYYKVRAYRTVGRTKVYSPYSQVTSARVIPSAPVVKADNYSYTSNIITWPIVSGASGYIVYLTDETGTDETLLTDNNANNKNSYTHEGLTTNQTYWYKVVAYRTVGANKVESFDSAAVSSKPIPTAPTVSVLLNTYNSLNIKWNTVTGADKYEIRRSDSSTGSFEKVGEATSDATNYIDTSLTTSATYYYKVVALIEPDIYGDESAVVSAKVLPAAPVVTVTPTAYNSLSLTWNSQDGVTGYRIYRATSSKGTYTLIKTVIDGSTSFVNTGLAAGSTYYYKLIAYRTDGAVTTLSPYSAVKYAKVIPAAPTGVSAQSASYNSIKVTWDKVTGASGYTVYRATSETGTYTAIASVTSAYSSYTSTALTTGTTYYYKVAAYRLAGTTKVYGTYSDITSAAPKPSIAVPKAESAGYNSVKISWPAALGASGYEVYQTDITGTTEIKLDDNVTATTYTDTDLTTNQTYYYKVKSYKTTASGKVYSEFSTVVNATPIPSTPVISVALNSYNSLNISWAAIDGATAYEVWRSTSSTGTFEKIETAEPIATNSYLDTSLTTGTTYYYQVRAYIEGDPKVYSNYCSVSGLKVTPTTPVITVTPNTYNSLSISWEAIEGATGYNIYRATSSSGTYTRIYTAGAGETSYVNTPLATGSTYYYKVLAYTTEGTVTTNSAYSAVKSAKVKPAAPTGAAAASASYTSIKITWNKVDGASGYTVYRLTPSTGSYTVTGINSVTYTNTGLSTGTTYTYKVAAYRLVGTTKIYGDYSEIVSAWPKPAAPVPSAVSVGYNSVKISWPAVGGASGYEIWDNAEHKIGEATNSVAPSYTVSGLTAGEEYSYKVVAYKTQGESRLYGDYSVVVNATPVPATPSITAVTPASYNSLNISWNAIDGAEKYEILRSTSSTGTYTSLTSVADTSYEDTDLTIGAIYYYKVKAYIEGTPNVYSLESAAKSATVVLPAPSSPAAATASATSINLTWSAVGGAEGYYIYRSTSVSGTYSYVNQTTLTTYTDTGRTTGATYYYKLKSYATIESNVVTSVYSAVVSAKATLLAPILTATLGGNNYVDLKWNIITGAVGYTVYRSTSLNGSYVLIETVTGDNEYTDYDDLVENATYYYKVKAYLLVGSTKVYGNDSNVQSVTTKYLPDFDAIPPSTNLSDISYITIQVVNYGTLPLTIYNYIEDDAYIINDDFYTLTLVNESNNPIESIVISPGSTKNIRFKVDNPPVQYTLGDTIWFDFAYDGVSYWADTDYYYGTWYFPYQ